VRAPLRLFVTQSDIASLPELTWLVLAGRPNLGWWSLYDAVGPGGISPLREWMLEPLLERQEFRETTSLFSIRCEWQTRLHC
jgi:hypothetical protein